MWCFQCLCMIRHNKLINWISVLQFKLTVASFAQKFNLCLIFLAAIGISSTQNTKEHLEENKNPNTAIAFTCCYIAVMCRNSPLTFKGWSKCNEVFFFYRLVGSNWNVFMPLSPPAACQWSESPKAASYLSATTCPRGHSALLPPPRRTTAKLPCWWALPLNQNKKENSLRPRRLQAVHSPSWCPTSWMHDPQAECFAGMHKGLPCTHVTEDWLFSEGPTGKQWISLEVTNQCRLCNKNL